MDEGRRRSRVGTRTRTTVPTFAGGTVKPGRATPRRIRRFSAAGAG